jgi:hypothetical protein
MDLTDWQLAISIVVSIVGSAVGATYFITRKITGVEKDVSKAGTDMDGLKERLKRVEDDLKDMFKLILEESRGDAAELRRELRSMKEEEQKKD